MREDADAAFDRWRDENPDEWDQSMARIAHSARWWRVAFGLKCFCRTGRWTFFTSFLADLWCALRDTIREQLPVPFDPDVAVGVFAVIAFVIVMVLA